MENQIDLKASLSRVLELVASLERALAVEEAVLKAIITVYPDEGADDGSASQSVAEASKSKARSRILHLKGELQEARAESVRITALMPVPLPQSVHIQLTGGPH